MIAPHSLDHATLLSLALDVDVASTHHDADWAALGAVAQEQRMTLRLAGWFERRGLALPDALAPGVAEARVRRQRVTDLAACIASRCAAQDIPHVFPKLRQRAPDTGSDLDVLVDADAFTGIPLAWSGVPVDVQYRRLGHLGEHTRFAARVLARLEHIGRGPGAVPIPCVEDAVLLLALGRVYGRPAVRLSDVCFTASVLRSGELDPDRLLLYAAEVGLQAGLACFLSFVDQVCLQLLDTTVLDARLRNRLPSGPWGRVTYRDGAFRGSVGRVTPVLYLRLLAADVAAGEWGAAGRASLAPLAAASRRWRSTPTTRQEAVSHG